MPRHTISQEQYIIWSWFLVNLCKMMISPGTCFIFKILVFQAVRGTKGQKMAQNDKNSVCHTSYLRNHNCLLWYTCVKWLYISRIFFYFLKMLIFWVAIGVKGQKMTQHEKKLSFVLHISGTIHHMIIICGTHV